MNIIRWFKKWFVWRFILYRVIESERVGFTNPGKYYSTSYFAGDFWANESVDASKVRYWQARLVCGSYRNDAELRKVKGVHFSYAPLHHLENHVKVTIEKLDI